NYFWLEVCALCFVLGAWYSTLRIFDWRQLRSERIKIQVPRTKLSVFQVHGNGLVRTFAIRSFRPASELLWKLLYRAVNTDNILFLASCCSGLVVSATARA